MPVQEDLISSAKALVPTLRERAPEAEALRRIPPETISDLAEHGLLGIVQPAKYGGAEASFDVFVDVLAELATGCPSTAWVCGNLCTHNWIISMFEEQAQIDVWGDDPNTVASGTLAPLGKLEAVDGGYQLSGKWQFASGCNAAQWGLFGAMAPPQNGADKPTRLVLLVPKSEWEIEDTWYTGGLRGTGSNDVSVAGTFVPAHRVIKFSDVNSGTGPGRYLPDAGLLPRLPMSTAWPYALAATAVGAATALVEEFAKATEAKLGAGSMASSGQVGPQLRLAEASAEVDTARGILRNDTQMLMAVAEAEEESGVDHRSLCRRNQAWATMLAVRAADRVHAAMGAHALFDGNPAGRFWRDAHAAQAHHSLVWDNPAESYARVRIGLEPNAKIF